MVEIGIRWKTYIMTTFWFGSRWALTRLARCPVIQWSRKNLRKYVKTSPFSGWLPPWRGSERGPRLGSSDWLERGLSWLGSWWALWLGGRATTPTSSWTKSELPNRSNIQPLGNSCCCRAAKLLHGAHSCVYLRGEGWCCVHGCAGAGGGLDFFLVLGRRQTWLLIYMAQMDHRS